MILAIVSFACLVLFLGCLGLFALAVTKVVAPDGKGHARGLVGGCASILALFLLCSLGLAGLAATVASIAVGSLPEWNPIRRIEVSRVAPESIRYGTSARARTQESAVAARFTVRGDAGGELLELLDGLVDVDLDELGDGLTIQPRTGPDGEEFAVYEFRLPISEAELERFERKLRVELDGLRVRLPERVDVEFEGLER